MNILFVSTIDIGGWGYFVSKAINKYTKHKAKNVVLQQTYLQYPIEYSGSDLKAEKLGDWADFFVLRWLTSGLPSTWADVLKTLGIQEKVFPGNYLVKLHGSEARMFAQNFLVDWLRGQTPYVTSHDYSISSEIGFSAQHLNHCIDFDDLPPRKPSQNVHYAVHLPTNKAAKGTQRFQEAFRNVVKDHPNWQLKMVENQPHQKAMEAVAASDILFDQFSADIGINTFGRAAAEGWAMGLPVLTSVNYWTLSMFPELKDIIPDPEAKDSLEGTLFGLIQDENIRREIGARARKFALKTFNAPIQADRWIYLIKHIIEQFK